jgi:hypothetical protein
MAARLRVAFALLWLILLAMAGWAIGRHMELSGDLRKFMPARLGSRRARGPEAARAASDLQGARP